MRRRAMLLMRAACASFILDVKREVCIYDAGGRVMAQPRVGELMAEMGKLQRDLKELRVDLKQKKEQLTIMQALPAADRREQNESTRHELQGELGKFTQAIESELMPRLREQRVYAPAYWRASMEHLRNLASTDMSGSEDVALETFEMFQASFDFTYNPPEERDADPFGYEFGMEFQANIAFHQAWTALLTAVARHTQVLLKLYDPSSVEDSFLRLFEIARDELAREASALEVQVETCKEAVVRKTGNIVHSSPTELSLASRASMRECLRRL